MSKPPSSPSDAVGYGKPPKWTQFRPGQSGNPSGRPMKQKTKEAAGIRAIACLDDSPARAVQQRVLTQRVKTRVGGEIREMTVEEATLQMLATSALKGNGPSQRELVKIAERLGDAIARDAVRAREGARANFDRRVAWAKNLRAIWQMAERRGVEPEGFWVHPDDIFLDEDRLSCRVRGPEFVSELPFYEYVRAQRDVHIHRVILGSREQWKNQAFWFEFDSNAWGHYDMMLPLRWQARPQLETLWRHLHEMPLSALRQSHDAASQKAKRLGSTTQANRCDKDTYATANSIIKPLLRHHGYRSLAEFEKACADTDGNPPWPNGPPLP